MTEAIQEHFGGRERLVDGRTVCEFLGIGRRTLTRLQARGQMPGYRIGGAWRYRLSEVERWLRKPEGRKAGRNRLDTGADRA